MLCERDRNSKVALKIKNVSKIYRIYKNPQDILKTNSNRQNLKVFSYVENSKNSTKSIGL